MQLTIGTFNLNNLFSRYNFHFDAEIEDMPEGTVEFEKIRKIVTSPDTRNIEYKGIALKRKDPAARKKMAERIAALNIDVLAVQEVEDIETLSFFVRHELGDGKLYPYFTLIEGNDPRLIDLAVLSKYPLGAVTSWQHATHSKLPNERVFSRDLLQVEVLSKDRSERLLTLFNNHLKSHFVPFTEDQEAGTKRANERRQLQAEMIAQIVTNRLRPDSPYAILGDMNDDPVSPFLKPLVENAELGLVNGLLQAAETRPAPDSSSPPSGPLWTHRFKPSGEPAEYSLFDHVWLSPTLATRQTGAFIDRRTKMGGDGSDHDPAWVSLNL
jgi:endonuclease/exonuclease/phosphatase family metal-dependent hydrolase